MMQTIQEGSTLQSPPGPPPRRRIAAACETCKRRKERCNGQQPCGRCVERAVEGDCYYVERKNERNNKRRSSHRSAATHQQQQQQTTMAGWSPYQQQSSQRPLENELQGPSPAASEHYARLIRDRKGSFMFVGDSATLAFLQIIRRVVGECLGPCELVDDPLRHNMVEASAEGPPSWLGEEARRRPNEVSRDVCLQLVRNYLVATSCALHIFDEAELLGHELTVEGEGGSGDVGIIPDAIYFLVLALGAQSSPENLDDLAERLFAHARYLTAVNIMEDASISTVQAHILIAMYLQGACRRNAAFMYMGTAVRAAYTIGLHRKEISATFAREEFLKRERLWRALRTLDVVMCASLGRPPATAETRDTEAGEDYSAPTDLCAIFEKILMDVYLRRMISTEALSGIGSHHRRWATRFFRGEDGKLEPSQNVQDGALPNISLMHVKAAYYWSIILLTRPFLVEGVTLHVKRAHSTGNPPGQPCTTLDNNKVLVNACVDSAIRILDVLKGLSEHPQLPRRLPFLINLIFISALVLGFAYFGDLNQNFPLQRHLRDAQQLLALFSHDLVAKRNAQIVGFLCDAAEAHLEKRTAQNMDYQSLAIGSMFGQIHRSRGQGLNGEESPNGNGFPDDGLGGEQTLGMSADVNLTALAEQADGSVTDDYRYAFDLQQDFGDLPFPPMTPRTLWFDELDGNMPLFSTISNSSHAQFDDLAAYV